MPRRTRDPRSGPPVVIEEESGYEFHDLSARSSSSQKDLEAVKISPIIVESVLPTEHVFERPIRARRVPVVRTKSVSKEQSPDGSPGPVIIEMKPQDSNDGFDFQNISYTTPEGKVLIQGISASVGKGEMLAIVGPSGSGKTTLLSSLTPGTGKGVTGQIMFEGQSNFDLRAVASYVPQDDALLGVLTVRETISYALRLSTTASPISTRDMNELVDATITSLGLTSVQNNKIGNAVQRGISGGQKRRVTLGTSLVTCPKVLFLDEPTSGLDSTSSRLVMLAVKKIAQETGMVAIASIHQPSYELLQMFDNLLLLAKGRMVYSDKTERLPDYLSSLGYPVPEHANPSDFAMDLMNSDFSTEDLTDWLTIAWKCGQSAKTTLTSSFWAEDIIDKENIPEVFKCSTTTKSLNPYGAFVTTVCILTQRNLVNYMRNLLAYGVRLAMYVGMGIMLATIWIRLAKVDSRINDRLGVHFYSVAFLAFMSVAGIPAFLEERAIFLREKRNGLYGPAAFTIASAITPAPYLFLCALLFTLITYWSIGLNSATALHPLKFLIVLFLAIYAAESQVVLITVLVPIFVAALAIASFMNGFWMSVQGYFIRAKNLPVFWYCWAHWIDYQTYAFQLLVKNDFAGLVFQCKEGATPDSCFCSVPSSLIAQGQCAVSGDDVLKDLQIENTQFVTCLGVMVIIIVVYRVLFWTMLVWKK